MNKPDCDDNIYSFAASPRTLRLLQQHHLPSWQQHQRKLPTLLPKTSETVRTSTRTRLSSTRTHLKHAEEAVRGTPVVQ